MVDTRTPEERQGIRVTEALHEPVEPRDVLQFLVAAAESKQPAVQRLVSTTIYKSGRVIVPPYDPAVMYGIYNNSIEISAAVDDMVDSIVGGGVQINPADVVDILGSSAAEDRGDPKVPDAGQLERLQNITSKPNDNPADSFCSINKDFVRDAIVTGEGYLEFGRDAADKYIESIFYAPSMITRLTEDPDILMQVDATQSTPFLRLGAERRVAIVQQLAVKHESVEAKMAVVLGKIGKLEDASPAEHVIQWMDDSPKNVPLTSVPGKSGFRIKFGEEKDGLTVSQIDEVQAESLNEILMAKFRDPLTSHYGRPKFLSAVSEYLLMRAITDYNIGFFEQNTVPPLAIVVKGNALADDALAYISNKLARAGGKDEAHKTLLVELSADASVEFVKLDSERANEGAFIKLRDDTGERLFAVLRVPIGRVMSSKAKAIEVSNRIYLESVVRPLRRWLEEILNRVFEEHLGITDWKISFAEQKPESKKAQAEISETFLTKGVININEVRSELGLKPVKGGDENFINIPGTGTVMISLLKEFTERALDNKTRNDIQPSGGAKTPETGPMPLLNPSGGSKE